MRPIAAAVLILLGTCAASPATITVLYNGSAGGTPSAQGWLYSTSPNPSATQGAAGGITTLITGRLADRFPRRTVLWLSILPLTPALLLFLLGGPAVAIVLSALIGATTIGTVAVSLVTSAMTLWQLRDAPGPDQTAWLLALLMSGGLLAPLHWWSRGRARLTPRPTATRVAWSPPTPPPTPGSDVLAPTTWHRVHRS